jgi:hypothetical protein
MAARLVSYDDRDLGRSRAPERHRRAAVGFHPWRLGQYRERDSVTWITEVEFQEPALLPLFICSVSSLVNIATRQCKK